MTTTILPCDCDETVSFDHAAGTVQCRKCGHVWRVQPHDVLSQLLVEHVEQAAVEAKGETDEARRAFIREAATRIYTTGMCLPPEGATVVGKGPAVAFSPRTCWLAAKALWDAKPEDC